MLLPTKHERLSQNSLVLGADILEILTDRPCDVHGLYEQMRSSKNISLDQFFDSIMFLWLAGIVEVKKFQVSTCA